MNRTLYVLVILGLLLFAASAFGENGNGNTHGFGVHFGNVSGNGYAYRYITDKLGIQLVVGGMTSGDNHYSMPDQLIIYDSPHPLTTVRVDNGRKYNFNLGGNIILPLKRTTGSMFYLHAGTNWKYSDQKQYKQDYQRYSSSDYQANYSPTGDVTTSHKMKSYFNVGIGPGVELSAGKYFKLALELPITYTGDNEFIMYIPQAGLYYYFK